MAILLSPAGWDKGFCQVQNGGFEDGTLLPWVNPVEVPDKWALDNSRSYTGQYSATTSTGASGGVYALSQDFDPPVPASAVGKLGYCVYATSTGSPNLAVGVDFTDGSYDQDLLWGVTPETWTCGDAVSVLQGHQETSIQRIYFFDMLEAEIWIDDVEMGCDPDEDGFESLSCGGDDCDDQDPNVNPGIYEAYLLCHNGKDDDCDGLVDSEESNCGVSWEPAPQSTVSPAFIPQTREGSGILNSLVFLFLPAGVILFLKVRRRIGS